jgi:hypothetical protein
MNVFTRALFAAGCITMSVAGTAIGEPAQRDKPTSVPARLPVEFEVALHDVEFPDYVHGEKIRLFCVTDVAKSGQPRHNTCLPSTRFDVTDLRKLIVKTMRKFKFSPAVLDGKTVATEFYYRIHIDTRGEAPRISMYPNWGNSSDLHGAMYDAPQRYEPRRFPPDCLFFVGVATTPVDAHGRATGEPEISTQFRLEEATLDCIDKIKTRLINGRYIPAQRDGNPVEAIHAEVWGDPERYLVDMPGMD